AARAGARPFAAAEGTVRSAASAPAARTAAAHRTHARLEHGRPLRRDDTLAHVRDIGNAPHALLAGDASEIDGAVGQPRRRVRWAGGAAAPALLRADRKEATEQHRAEQRAAEQGSHAFSPTPTRRGRPSGRPARWPGLKARPYVRVFETEAS